MLRVLAVWIARRFPTQLKQKIHASRGLDRFVRRAFSRMAAAGGGVAVIQEGPLKGIKLAVSEHTSHAHLTGNYERELVEAIDRVLQPGWVCYDLGASIGIMSLLMSRKTRKVYAFEPAPHAAAEMQRHIAANGFDNVQIVASPVSDQERDVSFALADTAYGSAIRDTPSHWPTLKLRSTTLDIFARLHEFPDFLKIDVEGEEGRVMEGARSILARGTAVICCELHNDSAAATVVRILHEFGYAVRRLSGETFTLNPGEAVPGELQVIALPPQR